MPVPKYKIYQIRVYATSKSNRHYTFCTPECKKTIDNYLDYRRSCGENITPRSTLLRLEFDKHDIFQVANDIKPITKSSVKKVINEALYGSGLRTPLITMTKKLNNRLPTAIIGRSFIQTSRKV